MSLYPKWGDRGFSVYK